MPTSTTTFDLSTLPWTVRGWHPNHWHMELTGSPGPDLPAMIGPIPARVPGSVQHALRNANLIPDWNVGLNSNACEWVENRHWAFQTTLPNAWCATPGQKLLHAHGLDHAGQVFVGKTPVGTFNSAHVPHSFDLTAAIQAQCPAATQGLTLTVLFTVPPRYLGQVGYSSQMRDAKPRFYYVWDWVVRLVQIGIWDSLTLETRTAAAIDSLRAHTDVSGQTGTTATGHVHVELSVPSATTTDTLRLELLDGDTLLSTNTAPATTRNHTLAAPDIQLWQPIGAGQQKLYTLRTTLISPTGQTLHTLNRRVGFRKISWEACEGAPASAEPWILNVNGHRHFIYGANWVPIRTNFADVTEADYRKFLQAYVDHGFNFLRVWGGATLEREIFYDLCDELGIMVWQEFPYSSSGLDNWTPTDPDSVAQAAATAESYIRRRQHHASLIMWCGGNELQWGDKDKLTGGGIPLGYDHPPIAAMKHACDTLDPTRRFLPTSSSGPNFLGIESDFGKGLHHDVHGPWNIPGTFAEWQRYWAGDDALIRSEVGVPGASSAEVIEAYCDGQSLPGDATNPVWRHVCTWWFQWKEYLAAGGNPQSLPDFVAWSQKRQADGLAVALSACLGRFPRCGGFIIWMGHDCFPCPINTAIFDWHANPKPAATALAAIIGKHGLVYPAPAIKAGLTPAAKSGHEPALAAV